MTESISGAYLSLQAKEGALVPNLGYAGRAQRQTEYKLKEGSKSLWNTGESKILSGAPEVLERIKNKTKQNFTQWKFNSVALKPILTVSKALCML